jgi:hypothetical protein
LTTFTPRCKLADVKDKLLPMSSNSHLSHDFLKLWRVTAPSRPAHPSIGDAGRKQTVGGIRCEDYAFSDFLADFQQGSLPIEQFASEYLQIIDLFTTIGKKDIHVNTQAFRRALKLTTQAKLRDMPSEILTGKGSFAKQLNVARSIEQFE